MAVFEAVLMKCIELLNLRISFPPYSFTFGSVLLALGALAIVVSFITHLFDFR